MLEIERSTGDEKLEDLREELKNQLGSVQLEIEWSLFSLIAGDDRLLMSL
jgi:hypothetical protein